MVRTVGWITKAETVWGTCCMRRSREDGGRCCESGPPGKSKIAKSFLRNTGTDPLGFKCYSRDLRPSVKYLGDKPNNKENTNIQHTQNKKNIVTHTHNKNIVTKVSVSAHVFLLRCW